MRSERVVTHFTCNQGCTYCDRRAASDPRAFAEAAAVRARIDQAVNAGAEELVLTGGEPTLRRDLPELVAYAAARAGRVTLETNGTRVDARVAAALKAAGLFRARVNVSAPGAASDGVTRDPGGAEATLRGLRALLEAAVPVEVSVTVVRSTAHTVGELPRWLMEAVAPHRLSGIVAAAPVTAPDPNEVLSPSEAAAATRALDAAGRQEGLAVRLSAESGLPPCAFESLPRASHLFSLTPGGAVRAGFRKIAACEACLVGDRCPGFAQPLLDRFGAPPVRPITDPHARRRVTLQESVEAQIDRELVETCTATDERGATREEAIIRVNFQCNQACAFCFVSTHLPAAESARVRAEIERAAARGAKIVLSGGEPTLNPALADYVALARSRTTLPVVLQTNAIRLGDAALTAKLVAAGLGEAFVSFHGCTPDVSDAVTSAPGTFVRTVAGVDHLVGAGVHTILNTVICEANHRQLPEIVRFIAGRWPSATWNVSFVAPMTDVVPQDAAMIPRYSDALPALGEALSEAARLGVKVVGFESMCGLPLCLIPSAWTGQLETPALADDRGEFVKTEACRACALEPRCYGLRRRYAALHGTSELRPVQMR